MNNSLYIRFWLLPVAGLLALVPAAQGQVVQTMLSLTGEGGYLTNTYLAPGFPVWEQTARAPFVSVRPRAGLTWSSSQQRLSVFGSGQYTFFPDRGTRWWVGRGYGRYAYALSERWTTGLFGAATRSETSFGQWLFWGAPFVRWQATPSVHLRVQAGATAQRYDSAEEQAGTRAETASPFASVEVGLRRERWTLTGNIYYSRTLEAETDGLGVALHAGRQLSPAVHLGVRAGMDQYAFASTAGGTPARSDQLLRTALTAEWTLSETLALSGRLGVQRYQTDADLADPNDLYASLGLTYRWNRSTTTSEAPEPLWVQEEEGRVRVQIPYDGEGQLYLVGDFNDWRQRETPLHPSGDGRYTTQLVLAPGTYQYRVQVVEDGSARWLSLPEHALTVEDGFGSENGVISVE